MNVQHSAASCEHGSPPPAVEVGRYALGGFDLDPTSSEYWNHHLIKATRYYDRQADGMRQRWRGKLWFNPPGADKEYGTPSLVRPGWVKLVEHYIAGDVEAAVFYGYSLEQLQQLQGERVHPARFVTLIFDGRQDHMLRPPGGGPPVPDTNPTHGNFMSLLPTRGFPSVSSAQIARFVEAGSKLGQVVRPW